MNVVEINSSFHRHHRRQTYERWAASVPADFRFAAKVPRSITHDSRLTDTEDDLARFLDEAQGLGDKLGPLLVQLPPSLAFDSDTARRFFAALRNRFVGDVVCEPRSPTWFTRAPAALLRRFRIGRVGADPAPIPSAATPTAPGGIAYYRLHGSPRVYYSEYASLRLREIAARLRKSEARDHQVWCIFDNTAAGAALSNALELQSLIDA